MTNDTPVASIGSSLLDYYSKLREHRCRITEGIRVIAFRNMDHLTAAERYVDARKPSDEEYYIRVQDKMPSDQGLEQTLTQRWLLASTTWVPWEIYVCLLYVEIENYIEISQKHTSLVYKPLEEYLVSHDAMIQSLSTTVAD